MSISRITDQFLKDLLESDEQTYFTTRSLNKKLYIHFKGLKKIENLEGFTALKVLYAEGNLIEKIENLENCKEIRCLYLQDNHIKEMTGIENLDKIHTLDLSGNFIEKIEGLEYKPCLNHLSLKRNYIGKNGVSDLEDLLDAEAVSVLDLSFNCIDNLEILERVVYKMKNLTVLYFQGNPICGKMKNYRKDIIARVPGLKYLDDRPVFDNERRFAYAFFRGGVQAERLERNKWDREQEEEQIRNRADFRKMIERKRMARAQGAPESTSDSAQGGSSGSQMWSSSTDNEDSASLGSEDKSSINYDDVE